jgi:hypothetical protein
VRDGGPGSVPLGLLICGMWADRAPRREPALDLPLTNVLSALETHLTMWLGALGQSVDLTLVGEPPTFWGGSGGAWWVLDLVWKKNTTEAGGVHHQGTRLFCPFSLNPPCWCLMIQ